MLTVHIKLRLLTLLSVYDVEKIRFLDSTNKKGNQFKDIVIAVRDKIKINIFH